MNTFWLKIAALVVVVIGLIILVNVFSTSKSEPKPQPKTFYDVAEEDDSRLRAEPEFEDIKQASQPPAPEPTPQPVPKFKQLSEIDSIEAERLFEFAIQQRKIGRLPVTGFKPMVDACRQIIQKFPGSEFDYKARRMLADIPQRYRERYKITEEEIDLTRFFK
jgi:hypothetical protein